MLGAILNGYGQLRVEPREKTHSIVSDKPAPDFFSGAVLGNGGMGVIVATRPDAVLFHFGHNNVWDIRVAEDNAEKLGTFNEVMARVRELGHVSSLYSDKDFGAYMTMAGANYRKPYPRPFPCGTVLLGFDRREMELLGHELSIADGHCSVFFLKSGKRLTLEVFTDMEHDVLWFRLFDNEGHPQPNCFNRIRVIPERPSARMPEYTDVSAGDMLGFRQIMPSQEPEKYDVAKGAAGDHSFMLEVTTNAALKDGLHVHTDGKAYPLQTLEKYFVESSQPFIGNVCLTEGLASTVKAGQTKRPAPDDTNFAAADRASEEIWAQYWNKSRINLSDRELEGIWYRNLYFFNCAVKQGVTCPGLFANWSYGKIGTEWHGDYHMNYNTQQPFWLCFSSNRLDKNLVYADLVDHLLPISRKWAKEYYGMRGAFIPHSAYPVDMHVHPYPVPDWGWEVFETPWTMQGLWWHYLYSMDVDFLRNRAYVPMKDAVMFLVDYMKRPDAHGKQWNDDRYHIFPSVPPELYGLQPDFHYNYDTQADICLATFIFKAFLEAVATLKYDKQEAALVKDVKTILAKMPEYSTTQSDKYGIIFTSVPGEGDKMVYNCPANLMLVFPGEQYGLDAPTDIYTKLVNTYRAHQNEGGNDIVFQSMSGVRLGILDIERFKRQVHYSTLPNGTATDAVMQAGGRYADDTKFFWMGEVGIWFENFALPTVINECLMQSYNGVIRLFPNWDRKKDALFTDLRAVGAFLVSCNLADSEIRELVIHSEKGAPCKLYNPWGKASVTLLRNGKNAETLSGDLLTFPTKIDEEIKIKLSQK